MALRVPDKQAAGWVGAARGRRVAIPPVRSKYRAVAVTVDGFRFASKAEAQRYQQLFLRGLAGELRNLELQPRFDLHVAGRRVGCYIADFRYEENVSLACAFTDGQPVLAVRDVIEDVKGVDLPMGRWKRRHCEAEYGISVTVVR